MTLESGSWVITWGDRRWSEDDLCGAHAALVALVSGKDEWAGLNPFAGPMTLLQILAAFISIADQRDAMEVIGELGRTPIKQLLSAVSLVE